MMTKEMYSSLRGDWRTPKALYAELDREFHFDYDPCPPNPEFDGLSVEWLERNYVNPPYGRADMARGENRESVHQYPHDKEMVQ
jgi:hypothetical protein